MNFPLTMPFSACADMFLQSYSRFRVQNLIDLPKEEIEIYRLMKEGFLTYAEASKRYAHRVVAKETVGRIYRKKQDLNSRRKALSKKEWDFTMRSRNFETHKKCRLDRYGRVKPEYRMKEDLEPLVIVDLPDWEDLPDSGRVSRA